MKIALIAHDRKKDDMVALAREHAAFLRQQTLMATGTTGGRLRNDVGLSVECLLSGPLGGDLQIGALAATRAGGRLSGPSPAASAPAIRPGARRRPGAAGRGPG